MGDNVDPEAPRIVTDHDRIEILAAKHGAAPTAVEGGESHRIATSVDADDRVTWTEFFEWFDDTDQALRYRPPDEGTDGTADFEVLGRHRDSGSRDATGGDDGDDSGETPAYGTDSMALSDTGDREPPVTDDEGSGDTRTDADGS